MDLKRLIFGSALACAAAASLVALQALAYSEPTATPPGNDATAPLTVGTSNQTKSGNLTITNGNNAALWGDLVWGVNALFSSFVGIGTAKPVSMLDVSGSASYNGVGFNPSSYSYFTSPGAQVHVIGSDNSVGKILIDSFGASGNSQLQFRASGGTPTSPSAVAAGQIIGYMSFTGDAAGTLSSSASGGANMKAVAESNWTTGTGGQPTYLEFSTNGNGQTTTERMRITGSGDIGISSSTPTPHSVSIGTTGDTWQLCLNGTCSSTVSGSPGGTFNGDSFTCPSGYVSSFTANGTPQCTSGSVSLPSGIICGSRNAYTTGVAPYLYYDDDGSSNTPCEGNTLTVTSIGGALGIMVQGVAGCPAGFTGKFENTSAWGNGISYRYEWNLYCASN